MSEQKPFRITDFSVPLASGTFLLLGLLYVICFVTVMACEESTGTCYPSAEITFSIITGLTYPLSEFFGPWIPVLLLHVIALMLDSVIIALVVHGLKRVFKPSKG